VKRARVAYDGAVHWVTPVPDAQGLRLPDGRVVSTSEVVWLAPLDRGSTIVALGLNYAERSAELGFQQGPSEPLIFLKGHNTLLGHQASSVCPAGAQQMHPECELVLVIGRAACRIPRARALDHVGAYTVANDYAIRDYLENYYRPNLRVKNRDGLTPMGPWLVDAGDVGDRRGLSLETRINGRVVQSGSTADMIFDVPFVIEYLSSFMTLRPGDAILTGAPPGTAFVRGGDVVETEIENIGLLRNYVRHGE
jgi:5-oxopent-3-ene-1,2,5-tricarboxylate decarboxylase/2-hydroxyhepta-2,4-diene-1,7-dioate isomerase